MNRRTAIVSSILGAIGAAFGRSHDPRPIWATARIKGRTYKMRSQEEIDAFVKNVSDNDIKIDILTLNKGNFDFSHRVHPITFLFIRGDATACLGVTRTPPLAFPSLDTP